MAVEIAPASHWPDMCALILVVSAAKKTVSSTAGMQTTVKTSTLFPKRAEEIVPQRMQEMEQAIRARDFETFAKITMRESNSFHATCLDTEPPIFYLNDVSRAAIRAVERINDEAGKTIAAYTFDAGPNAVIYYSSSNKHEVLGPFHDALHEVMGWEGEKHSLGTTSAWDGAQELAVLKEGVSRVILTSVGEGPQSVQDSLIGDDGEPVKK